MHEHDCWKDLTERQIHVSLSKDFVGTIFFSVPHYENFWTVFKEDLAAQLPKPWTQHVASLLLLMFL